MKTKILIVEDDPNIRFGLKEVLQAEGFAIAVCERGDHAMDAVMQEQPALVGVGPDVDGQRSRN